MQTVFINENTLGHSSYLRPFAQELDRRRAELGIHVRWLEATPLPPDLERRAHRTIRGLRRWGLDFFQVRWRRLVSQHVREQMRSLHCREPVDAIVVNTQSVALGLPEEVTGLPVFVCLDATFAQLARGGWFATPAASRWLAPWLVAPLRREEQRLFSRAHRLLPWSELARRSLLKDYQVPDDKVSLLPPSVGDVPPRSPSPKARPQLLFVGGDFARKGGPLLLECFRRHFAARCELHVVTQSPVEPEPGVVVHRGIQAGTALWRQRWEQADVFVFPSRLETFGIVLVEALAFGVPVVAARAGAADEVLAQGRAGLLLPNLTPEALVQGIEEVLRNPSAARQRAAIGRHEASVRFNLASNACKLAEWLRESAVGFS